MKKKKLSRQPKRVHRIDSIKTDLTYFTDEGYLIDHPIVTSCGIFEYMNPDGSIRRELRLPEHVFEKESLESYKGKPVIVTHDAGVVDKTNVDQEHIGTILTAGYRDGDDVRAEIVIHDTDAMEDCDLRELSLGYDLELLEEPGVWKGEPYDAIQTGIRINHLALVDNARAGDQARLNIDNSDELLKGGTILKGKKKVTKKAVKNKRNDSRPKAKAKYKAKVKRRSDSKYTHKRSTKKRRFDNHGLSPEELEAAVQLFMQTQDEEEYSDEEEYGDEEMALDAEEVVAYVIENRDHRDSDAPSDLEEAIEIIAQQDEDIDALIEVVEALQPVLDEDENTDEDENSDEEEYSDEDENSDEDEYSDEDADEDEYTDDDDYADEDEYSDEDEYADDDEYADEEEYGDNDESGDGSLNADSADRLIRKRLVVCRIGDKLNMDGLETMSLIRAKKAIIRKVMPTARLDGKSKSYVNACYDMAVQKVRSRKSTAYQKSQMYNSNRRADGAGSGSASSARQRMMNRREGGR